jgi:transcriptional antiterminator NusG
MEKQWYVVHTYSGYENKVKANLEKRIESMNMEEKIFRILVPMEDEIEIKDGKKKITKRKIFPGYVLVEMFMTDDSWYVVRNTPGVTGFVGSGSKPIPLNDAEATQIVRQLGGEEVRLRVNFSMGENVRVISGPFENFIGVIDEINLEKGKLRVVISMFGRETPIELDFAQVEKIS